MSIKELSFLAFLKKGYEKEEVSQSTQKSYLSILKNVRKGLNYNGTTLHFTKDVAKLEEHIKDKSKSYKISAYSAIVKLTTNKKLKKQYQELINSVNQLKIEESKQGRYTDKERKTIGGLSWTDLETIIPMIREELKEMDVKDKQYYMTYQYLVLSLVYLKCKFLPRLDYCSIKVIYNKEQIDTAHNQLLVEDDKMSIMFNKYKNCKAKNMGNKTFEICDEIRGEVSDWLFFKTNSDKDNLFYNLNKSKPYDNKRFSDLIKRMFLRFLKHPVSCNHIRKLKERKIQTDPEYVNLSPEDREKAHELNFHSKATAELHYQKT